MLDVLRGAAADDESTEPEEREGRPGRFSDVKFGAAYQRWREDDPGGWCCLVRTVEEGCFIRNGCRDQDPEELLEQGHDKLSKHERCGETAQLMYVGPSSISDKNDGLNCYEGGFLQPAPTNSPTEAPCLDASAGRRTGTKYRHSTAKTTLILFKYSSTATRTTTASRSSTSRLEPTTAFSI